MRDSKRWLSFFAGVAITVAFVVCGHFFFAENRDLASLVVTACAVITLLVTSGCIYMASRAWEEVNKERRHFDVIKSEVEAEVGRRYAQEALKRVEEESERMEKDKQFRQNSFEAGYRCGYRDCQEGIDPEYTFSDEE